MNVAALTSGINHLGLTVLDIQQTADFFVRVLNWSQGDTDSSYPKTSVSDGKSRLTLWECKADHPPLPFNRHANVGLHHLALQIDEHAVFIEAAEAVRSWPYGEIEFMPEPMGNGPRVQTKFVLDGGPRMELIWPGP